MTLLELVLAMVMITIIFAAVLPQFAVIRNSWDSKQGSAEALQNGRVLMDHISRNLSKGQEDNRRQRFFGYEWLHPVCR